MRISEEMFIPKFIIGGTLPNPVDTVGGLAVTLVKQILNKMRAKEKSLKMLHVGVFLSSTLPSPLVPDSA